MRSSQLVLVLAVALLGLFGVRSLPVKAGESLEGLRKKKRDDAEGWYHVAVIAFETGTAQVDLVYSASVGWKNASLELATDKAGRMIALEAHRDRMVRLVQKIRILKVNSVSGGELDKERAARFWDVEPKIWLLEEKNKP